MLNQIPMWAPVLVLVITSTAGVVTYVRDLDDQLEKIEVAITANAKNTGKKIEAINRRFESVGLVDEQTLNSKIAKNGNVISKLQFDLAGVQQSTSELLKIRSDIKLLAEQVNTLKSNSFSSGGDDQATGKIKKLIGQIEAIEKRLNTMEAGGLNLSKKIEIKSNYSTQLETKSLGGFDLSHLGCVRKNKQVECSVLVINTHNENNYGLSVYGARGDNSARAFGSDGQPILASGVRYGNRNDRQKIYNEFPPQIPSKYSVEFRNVSSDFKGFLGLEYRTSIGYVTFHNVAIQ